MKKHSSLIKKTLSISLIAVSFLMTSGVQALLLPSDTGTFTDIQNHWGKTAIEAVAAHCKLKGYTDAQGTPLNIFKPDNSITRAELAQMLIQCKFPDGIVGNSQVYFSDVSNNEWYSYAVNKAKELGWIDGYSNNTFLPNNNVNRAEAVKMITLTKFSPDQMVSTTNTGDADFFDVDQNAWYASYVRFAVGKSYISGYKNSSGSLTGYFGPDKKLTRAEAAKIIALVNEWLTPDQITPPPAPSPTPTPSPSPAPSGTAPKIGGCQIFPSDNPWNQDISNAPLHPDSSKFIDYINGLGGNQNLHPDFGGNGEYGIPYTVVGADQSQVPVNFTDYPDESDPGPYPIPPTAQIENGSDSHVIVVDKDNCKLYELYAAYISDNGWNAANGAIFDLTSNALRPEGWTSADAAGLPIFAGLVRFDEVSAGSMNHAIRVTFSDTQRGYIHPATHMASDNTDAFAPPMGLRLRLKADYDISEFTGQSKTILETMKKYGLIVADNGSNWYFQGNSDLGWNDEELNQLKNVPGSAFEVVDTGPIIK